MTADRQGDSEVASGSGIVKTLQCFAPRVVHTMAHPSMETSQPLVKNEGWKPQTEHVFRVAVPGTPVHLCGTAVV